MREKKKVHKRKLFWIFRMYVFMFELQSQNYPQLKLIINTKMSSLSFFPPQFVFLKFLIVSDRTTTAAAAITKPCYLKATGVIFQNNNKLNTRNHIRNSVLIRLFFRTDLQALKIIQASHLNKCLSL